MEFEEVLQGLNKRGIMLDNLSQIEDGKRWSSCVRKQGTTKMGYGNARTIEGAVKAALSSMRDSFSPAEWSKVSAVKNPVDPKKKKRIKLRGK